MSLFSGEGGVLGAFLRRWAAIQASNVAGAFAVIQAVTVIQANQFPFAVWGRAIAAGFSRRSVVSHFGRVQGGNLMGGRRCCSEGKNTIIRGERREWVMTAVKNAGGE